MTQSAAPDKDCFTLPNGECIAPNCQLHGALIADTARATTLRIFQFANALGLTVNQLAGLLDAYNLHLLGGKAEHNDGYRPEDISVDESQWHGTPFARSPELNDEEE